MLECSSVREGLVAQRVQQRRPLVGGGAKPEARHGRAGKRALYDVRPRLLSARREELLMEEARRVLAERPQALLPLVGGGVLVIVRYIHSHALGKEAHRVRIVEICDLHDEIHHAAALVAAEAVVNALVGRYREGGCFFRMEWAQAKQIAALAGQGNVLADHVLNGIAGRQLVEKCWREWHCSLLSAPK